MLTVARTGPSTSVRALPERSDARATRVEQRVREVLEKGLAAGAYPGAIAVVGTRDGLRVESSVGSLGTGKPARPGSATLWDLASLTKVVATTTAVLQLVEKGSVLLDAPVSRYLPRFSGGGKDRVTVRQLLTHASGLPASAKLQFEPDAKAAQSLLYSTPLKNPPGEVSVYSDLNAILLGDLVKAVTGQALDAYLRDHVFTPLKMSSTRFNPTPPQRQRTAPTEFDALRQRWLHGEVHDEKAWRLGGVAGHAGLFSSARDVSRFAQMLLNGGTLDGVRVLEEKTLRALQQPDDSRVSTRTLGWETAKDASSAGRKLSPQAFGHTGFTGTSLWVDPVQGVFVLLLSNRVHPNRDGPSLNPLRTELTDAALGALFE